MIIIIKAGISTISPVGIDGMTDTNELHSAHLSLQLKKKNLVIYGHCLLTLHGTINETAKWLTSLPIRLNAEIILVVTV